MRLCDLTTMFGDCDESDEFHESVEVQAAAEAEAPVNAIPEPGGAILFGLGIALFAFRNLLRGW